MDVNARIGMEVAEKRSAEYKKNLALKHGNPEHTDQAIFDMTPFGQRDLLDMTDWTELVVEELEKEVDGVLDI